MKPLSLDRGIDTHLKPVKDSDGTITALEVSTDKVRVKNLEIYGDASLTGNDVTLNAQLHINNTDTPQLKLTDTNATVDFDLGSNGNLSIESNGGHITLKAAGSLFMDSGSGDFSVFSSTLAETGWTWAHDTKVLEIFGSQTGDKFKLTVNDTTGATELETIDTGGATAHLTLNPDGDLIVSGADVKIDATKDLYLDGGGDTYITESSADVLDIKVGNDLIFQITESGADGNTIDIDNACIGFTQQEPTYDATNTIVDFRHSNKQFLTFGSGNITSIVLTFPLVSGNFVLLLKQDATGSRTVTNYKAAEFDESAADGSTTVKFAGGSNPTLTTDANHVDILSFYWDADNEIAYGVATLDFQF